MRRTRTTFSKVAITVWLWSVTLVLLGLSLALSQAGAQTPSQTQAQAPGPQIWDQKFFNPHPVENDFMLPMPCGGSMAFRPIEVVSGSRALSDYKFELGQSDDPNLNYKEGRRTGYIAGTFSNPTDPSRRQYYLAKYEVNQLQYDAFSETCPTPSTKMRIPVANVTWFDAVAFTQRYTQWLYDNSREALPEEEGLVGYLRLPSEAEWEFAARGGLSIDKAGFNGKIFPMPDGELKEYVWYQGSASAAGQVRPSGLLKANPLYLHDMLGNVSEMVLDPFRLTRPGRMHGQVGGFISKGGDIRTSQSQIRSSWRQENAFFDHYSGTTTKSKTLGFRLVLSAPVITTADKAKIMQQEYAQLSEPDQARETADAERDAMLRLQAAEQASQNAQLKQTLRTALNELERAQAEQNDIRNRTLRALIQSGAVFANKLRVDQARLSSVEKASELATSLYGELFEKYEEAKQEGSQAKMATAQNALNDAVEKLENMATNYQGLKGNYDSALSYYGDMIIAMAVDYSLELVQQQLAQTKSEFRARNSNYLSRFADLFVSHIAEYQRTGQANPQKWSQDIAN